MVRRVASCCRTLLPMLLLAVVEPGSGTGDGGSSFAGDPAAGADGLASVPVRLEWKVVLDGSAASLSSDHQAAAMGMALLGPAVEPSGCAGPAVPGRLASCPVTILSWAHFGEIRGEGRSGSAWQLEAQPGPAGRVEARWAADGGLEFPGRLVLRPELVLTLEGVEEEPLRLRSRERPELSGSLEGWPPFTEGWPPTATVLTLTGKPVAFYRETELGAPGAVPMVRLREGYAVLGTQPTAFFEERPRIVAASGASGVVGCDDGPAQGRPGVTLSWTPTAERVRDVAVTHYTIYRNPRPDDPSGWRRWKRRPAVCHRVVDPEGDFRSPVAYRVTHGTDLPLGGTAEGLAGPALRLELVRPESSNRAPEELGHE